MAGDIATIWDSTNQCFDWTFTSTGDIADTQAAGISDLQNAVSLSLFTDKQAPNDFVFRVPMLPQNKRGWWGDVYRGSKIGSWLWLLRELIFSEVSDLLQTADNYVLDALQWIPDNNIGTVTANTTLLQPANSTAGLLIAVTITQPNGNQPISLQYTWAWHGVFPSATTTSVIPAIAPGNIYFILDESLLDTKVLL